MIDLCECVPFMIPYDEYKICNLENIPCLNKFKREYSNFGTSVVSFAASFRKMEYPETAGHQG